MQSVCVIGAGVVGTSVAYHLSRFSSVRVSVIDSGYPGAGVTSAGTGWITARGSRDSEYRAFRTLAMEEYGRLEQLLQPADWMTSRGTLFAEDAVDDFDAMLEECSDDGVRVDELTAGQVNDSLEPHVRFSRGDVRVAYFPTEFTVSGSTLTRRLFEAATGQGVVGHFGSRVIALSRRPGGGHVIALSNNTRVEADIVVNAAGAGADVIAQHYGIPMPMRPQSGIGVLARTAGKIAKRMVTTGGLAIKPEAANLVRLRSLRGWNSAMGATQQVAEFTGDMELNAFVDQLISDARRILPDAELTPLSTWTGVRPFPEDGLPRIGAVSEVPGYFEAVMHSGAALGPMIGRLLAQEIVTGDESSLLGNYRPSRFFSGLDLRGTNVANGALRPIS